MTFSHSDLTMADRRLARARESLEQQREIIEDLAARRQDTTTAEALFKTLRRSLEGFEADRRAIEDEMFAVRADHH